jgi:stringent starvation protein B
MKPLKPHLFKAVLNWIVENDWTPYILVRPSKEVICPSSAIVDGNITLNLSSNSIRAFIIDEDSIEFNTKFAGKDEIIYIPLTNVLAIYSKETMLGMAFEEDEPEEPIVKKPHLRVVH